MRLSILGLATKALALPSITQYLLAKEPSDGPLSNGNASLVELPGGSPFSLCPVSSSKDIFEIDSVELTKQPVHFNDYFTVHLYGTFRKTFTPDATMKLSVDCGSHCEEYGAPPGETPGDHTMANFCELSEIEQPLGGRKKKQTCPPEKGHALITSTGLVMDMFFRTPGWYNFTFDAKTADGDRIYCLTTEVCLRWEDPEKNKHFPPGPWNNCTWPR